MSIEHHRLIVRHHVWAVESLLGCAKRVSPDELHHGELSHGSLFSTLLHMADVDQSWGRRARNLDAFTVEDMERTCTDLQSLGALWRDETARSLAFIEAATAEDLEQDVRVPWRDEPFTVWQILLHIAIHRAEHGNEAGNQLSKLGQSPGELGLLAYVLREPRDAGST